MSDLSNALRTALTSIEAVLRQPPGYTISLVLRTSAKTAEGVST